MKLSHETITIELKKWHTGSRNYNRSRCEHEHPLKVNKNDFGEQGSRGRNIAISGDQDEVSEA